MALTRTLTDLPPGTGARTSPAAAVGCARARGRAAALPLVVVAQGLVLAVAVLLLVLLLLAALLGSPASEPSRLPTPTPQSAPVAP